MGKPDKVYMRKYEPEIEALPLPVLDFINTQIHLESKLLFLEVCETEYTREYTAAMYYLPGDYLILKKYGETLEGVELRDNTMILTYTNIDTLKKKMEELKHE